MPSQAKKEVIFDPGTTFTIRGVRQDEPQQLWLVDMILSSETTRLRENYRSYVQQRLSNDNPLILLGSLYFDVWKNHFETLRYFHSLLRSPMTDDLLRANIHFHIGRVYRSMNKYTQALEHLHKALELQMRALPQTALACIRTIDAFGILYRKMGYFARAVHVHERTSRLYSAIVPEDSPKRIMMTGSMTKRMRFSPLH